MDVKSAHVGHAPRDPPFQTQCFSRRPRSRRSRVLKQPNANNGAGRGGAFPKCFELRAVESGHAPVMVVRGQHLGP